MIEEKVVGYITPVISSVSGNNYFGNITVVTVVKLLIHISSRICYPIYNCQGLMQGAPKNSITYHFELDIWNGYIIWSVCIYIVMSGLRVQAKFQLKFVGLLEN
jgi:amino acid permease